LDERQVGSGSKIERNHHVGCCVESHKAWDYGTSQRVGGYKVHPNDIFDTQNPAAHLYKRHVVDKNYGCIHCKSETGSAFCGVDIDSKDLIHFQYNCSICGSTSRKTFSLEEVKTLMRQYASGDECHFWECWVLCRWYKHLVNDYKRYAEFCLILKAPEKSRWKDAMSKFYRLVGIK
jgi:transcription elongation factor Elf1